MNDRSYKIWLIAGTSEYLALLVERTYFRYVFGSENVTSADNQQERLDLNCTPSERNFAWHIVGFTDGEGSFNVSFKRDPSAKSGWKIGCSFHISQKM